MARGFESKDVEFQQAERERARETRPESSPAAQRVAGRRAELHLALTRSRSQLQLACAPAYRGMLEQAIATLEAELASLPS
jgi:hypothetical protein